MSMDFVNETINDKSDINEWFDKYVNHQSALYKGFKKDLKNSSKVDSYTRSIYQIWRDMLCSSNIHVETHTTCNKVITNLCTNNNIIGTINKIKGQYKYTSIYTQGLGSEYIEQFL